MLVSVVRRVARSTLPQPTGSQLQGASCCIPEEKLSLLVPMCINLNITITNKL